MQVNFHLDSNKSMASPFSFSVHNNPSLIIIVVIFLSMVRPVAYSEIAVPVSFLEVPHLSYLWNYIRKQCLKFAIHPFLTHILPKGSCSYQYLQLWELRLFLGHYTKAILSRTAFHKRFMRQLVNYNLCGSVAMFRYHTVRWTQPSPFEVWFPFPLWFPISRLFLMCHLSY
jgi:hypothetical protein